ncbi:MAG: methionine gamma-lyase family protein, partial [Clostridiales bacterium]|nr:methionine gamma-lyase family protein [Clostridiales bacterium]
MENMLSYTYLEETFGIKKNLITLAKESETELKEQFSRMDGIAEYNQLKVLHAMQKNRLSESHFVPTTGYGYHDAGRNVLEEIYTDVFKAESALVRPQIISGTHALTTALFSCLHHGDELLSAVGKPYDTLESVIGIRPARGSLAEYGITYRQAELVNGCVDWGNLKREINSKTKVVLIQRSKGYAWRKSLTNLDIGELIGRIKSIRSDLICLVDNCYGEFVDTDEPIEFGADLVVGSLIKNPGGGIAPVGGYIAGKKEYVENAAARLTAPGLGKEVGPSLGLTKALTQGLFFAPQAVNASVKAAIFAAHILEKLG